MATEESLIVGVVLVVLGVISAIYGTILCFTTKVQYCLQQNFDSKVMLSVFTTSA